ncbi:MAG TPA: nuclear transport factor 2 family protein [Acidimicrobiia bacterium]|nr:nuclear transport factor 2 family protein [Acidimicrobiia bacterium]
MDTQKICDRYMDAIRNHDFEAQQALLHPDFVATYPQSGEVFRGRDNYIDMLRHYPELPYSDFLSIKGESHTSVQYPTLPMLSPTITVFGGDDFVVEGLATYADGGVFHVVFLLHLEQGLVKEETWYFAAPFDAPEWRRPYVDQ